MRGHKRYRSGAWRLVVFAGFDEETGRRVDVHETVPGLDNRAGAIIVDNYHQSSSLIHDRSCFCHLNDPSPRPSAVPGAGVRLVGSGAGGRVEHRRFRPVA